ncbi:hypothetical protein CCS92_29680, partial [Methylobacterium radiotolerans]
MRGRPGADFRRALVLRWRVGRRPRARTSAPYSIVGASFFTLATSSPSHAAFLAVPSKVALVLNSSYLPSRAVPAQ